MLTVVPDDCPGQPGARDGSPSLIDEIVREGARRMLAEALQAEVEAYIVAFAAERDDSGRRLVVRNGYHQSREVLSSAGAVQVTAPRVNDKRTDPITGERKRFSSAILPAWARKTPKVTEVLPLLYLHGLSSGDFVPALGQFLGSSAGLSGPVITKLTEQWQAEQRAFAARDLSQVDYVYVWADGIHVNIRLEEHKLCLLVMIGVRADGRKELIALADGYRESTESWADLLRDAARRGMRAPLLAAGDGALGFWGALREVFPATAEQRCWFHKTANVLAALPRSAHPAAKKALAEIWGAEDKDHAQAAAKSFAAAYGAKFPKAAAKVTDDLDQLLAFYDFPAEHWVHLRTTNPIESTFATVRHRTKLTKGPRLAGRRAGHGVQAHPVSPRPLAHGQRTPPRCAGQGRGTLRTRCPGRAARAGRGMTAVALRPATPADSEFCFQLHKAAMGDYVTAIWGWDEQVQRDFHARAFNPHRWQIITAGGADIGMLDIEYRPAEIYLARIELLPDHQGHGIGARLISALLDEARQKHQDLVLDVLAVNYRARALYQQLGMTEVAWHGDNYIKITMRSPLAAPAKP